MSQTESALYKDLLDLCNGIYSSGDNGINSVNIRKDIKGIADFAKDNRLDHYLAVKCDRSLTESEEWKVTGGSIVEEYNGYKQKILSGLNKIKQALGNESFMVIKTFSCYPHITSDLDVLVQDTRTKEKSQKIIEELCKNEPEGIEIDINHEISWSGANAVSKKFTWDNTQEIEFEGLRIPVPNAQLDTIIRIGHMAFELAQIRLGELLHMFRQSETFEWSIIEEESRRMKWPKTFKRLENILDRMHMILFNEAFLNKRPSQKEAYGITEFPYQLPYSFLALAVIEKRAWNKVYGGRYIIKDRILRWLRNTH